MLTAKILKMLHAAYHYLLYVIGDSVAAAVTLLESFCHCRTVLNNNATRCAQLFKLQYSDCSRKLVGVAVEVTSLSTSGALLTLQK